MKKAFVIDGGAGRVLCSIPALEYYANNTSEDFIIIVHGWSELFLNSKILRNKVYSGNSFNQMNVLKDYQIITPEPYRLNAYFTQKCNLVQAFDILINQPNNLETIPETKTMSFDIGRSNYVFGQKIIDQAKHTLHKNKTIVFQPFGSTAVVEGNYVLDTSGRSFELSDAIAIVDRLSHHYNIIMMTNLKVPVFRNAPIITPEDISLLQWCGIINASDYFIGCDSVGQHLANTLNKPSSIVFGGTYPENTSYVNNSNFKIYDNGKDRRMYSPLRISQSLLEDRTNEDLMTLSTDKLDTIINNVFDTLGVGTNSSCCDNENCETRCNE